MTNRQKEVFDWIFEYIKENGHDPHPSDVAKNFGFTYTSATYYMKRLERLCRNYKVKTYNDYIKLMKDVVIEQRRTSIRILNR